ncbi:MAG: TonB-dependent receptor [Treponemataceae bacterium]
MVFFFLFLTFSVFAQVEADTTTDVDVTVTASRIEESVTDNPAYITVITAQEIEDSGKSSLVEVISALSNVQVSSFASNGDAQISMRGFVDNSFGRVLVLIDGIRQNNIDMKGINWLTIPLSSIERIEIIDGSNSALYGNNAVAGTINIITKESYGQDISVQAEYGMYNDAVAQVVLDFADEMWGIGSALSYFGSTGWRDRTNFQSASAVVNSFFDFNNFLYIRSNFKYSFSYVEYPGSLTKEEFEENPRFSKNQHDDSFEHNFSFYINPLFTIDDEINMEIPISYLLKTIDYNTESFTPATFSDRVVHSFDCRPIFSFVSKKTSRLKMNMIAGVDFNWTSLNNKDFLEKEREDNVGNYTANQLQVAPYISTKFFLPFNFSIQAVIRYDFNFLDIVKNSQTSSTGSLSYQAFVYSLNLLYNPIKQLSLYFTAGTVFRYPFIDEITNFSSGWEIPINDKLRPEFGYNFDFGFKVNLGKYFMLNANVFFMPLVDEISYSNETFRNENLDATMRIGTNMDISSRITSFFEISASFSYLNAEFSNGANKGKVIPLVSPYSAGLALTFLLPQDISLSTDLSYRSSFYSGGDFDNSDAMLKGYFLWNLGVFYSPPQLDKKLSFSFVMKNLLNQVYVPYAFHTADYSAYYPARGFSLSAGVKYSF